MTSSIASGTPLKILAVVVTYNRLTLLKRCVDHLLRQSRPLDKILVIDNSSTDGTADYLKEAGIANIRQANTGASGGWSTGITECLDGGFDYIWLMDDDGFPDREALATLVASLTPEIVCLSSAVVKENSPEELVFGLPVLDHLGQPKLFGFRRKYHRLREVPSVGKGRLYPYAHMFNGALIRADAIRSIGNVEKEFFVSGEELDYLWRLKRIGGVYTHVDALHLHPDADKRPMPEARAYYAVRNSIVISRRYLGSPRFRAVLAVVIVLTRILNRNGVGSFLSYLVGRNQRVIRMAVSDGLAQRLGIFAPTW